jgi:hypothetical protein
LVRVQALRVQAVRVVQLLVRVSFQEQVVLVE